MRKKGHSERKEKRMKTLIILTDLALILGNAAVYH